MSTEYQYDPASRLTALIYRSAAGQLGDLAYTYDPAGNRTGIGGTFARTLLPDLVASATYDAANRQLTFGGQTLGYDANGNLTSDTTTTYTWDARNRLVALTGPTTASFQYDALGRRAQKTINANTTRFQYDGLNPILEATDSGLGAAMLTGLTLDEYLTRTDANGVHALLVDALGSTLAETDPAGTVVTSYSYEPFGRAEAAGAVSTNAFQYTGREIDGTGLYYYRARYYHPTLSRFIGEDPIGSEGHHRNLYIFVLNDPVLLTDPLGLWDTAAIVGGVLTIGVGVGIGSGVLAAAGTVATAAGAVVVVAGTVVALQFIVSGVGEIIVGAIAPPGTDLPPITPVGLATLIATRGDIKSAKAAEEAYSAGKLVTRGVRSIGDLLEVIRLGVDVYRDGGSKPNVPMPPLLPADYRVGRGSDGAPALGGRK